ncbi:MAG: hypothetical protein R2744_11710 [Bacteroidales bacterium]
MLFVLNELGYDRFNINSRNISELVIHAMIGDTRIDRSILLPSCSRTCVNGTPRLWRG